MKNYPYKKRLENLLNLNNSKSLIVKKIENIFYLTGFWGSAGILIIHNGSKYLFVDSRYFEYASNNTIDTVVLLVESSYYKSIIEFLKKEKINNIDIEKNGLSYEDYESMTNIFTENAIGFTIVDSIISNLRISKDKEEIEIIKDNLLMTEKALTKLLAFLKEGVTELDIARELYYIINVEGGEKTSFDSIVLFGERSSLPHGRPSDRALRYGDNILLDFGIVKDGYRTDITRTFFLGKGDNFEYMSRIYDAVRMANLEATKNLHTGMACKDVDAIARNVLKEYELDKYFGHGLGHGVGLEIHENPFLNAHSKLFLEKASIITIEPGVYVPNIGGVRIENMVLVTKECGVSLNNTPIDIIVL